MRATVLKAAYATVCTVLLSVRKMRHLVNAKPALLAQISHDVVGQLCVLDVLHLFRRHVQGHHRIRIQGCIDTQFWRTGHGRCFLIPQPHSTPKKHRLQHKPQHAPACSEDSASYYTLPIYCFKLVGVRLHCKNIKHDTENFSVNLRNMFTSAKSWNCASWLACDPTAFRSVGSQ